MPAFDPASIFGSGSSYGGGNTVFGNRGQQFGLNSDQGFGSRNSGMVGMTGQGYGIQDYLNHHQGLDQLAQVNAQQKGALDVAGVNNAGETTRANIAAQAATLPARLREQNFNQVFPFLKSQLSALGTQGGLARAGGQSGPSPEISVGPVLNDQQIQQQVNATRASNDATAANQTVQDQRDAGGRGFASNSPLLAMLNAGRQMSANQANTQAEQGLRLNAAQQNAGHILDTQQAREQQFASRQQEDIQRRVPVFAQQNALIAALSGIL